MRRSYFEIYVHLIWATKNREDMINKRIEASIVDIVREKAKKHHTEIVEIGNTDNHIHVLVWVSPNTVISEMVKEMKATTSYYVNHNLNECLYWQDGYGALSVSRKDVENVKRYVKYQKEHHAGMSVIEMLERI